MNKKYALVIVTGLLLSGSEWCYGQDAAPVESAAQGKMREKTKSDLAAEKIQKKQQTNAVLSPETETIKKTEPDILMKAKREYSQKPEAGMVKIECITKSDQPIQKKEEKELREKEGSQKMHNTYKVHKAQKMDGAKKMKIIQNSAIEHKK
jgi:hypothetical protein